VPSKAKLLPTIFLAHGAAGTAASMRPYVRALESRGLKATAVSLRQGSRPVPKAERAVPNFLAAVPAGSIAGGQSYGGRVASMAALETSYGALVLLSYPLHRPGHPESLRIEHWPSISCPVLLLSGESDPFARLDLLKESVRLLPNGRLMTFPKVGHGLLSVLDPAMDEVVAFLRDSIRAD
jgi:predicted alpha/beta-hydrolase family hydrolase